MRTSLLALLAGAGAMLSTTGAMAVVNPDAWYFEIDGDYGSIISDLDGTMGNHNQLAYEVTDGGASTLGTRDSPYCYQWKHESWAPFMGSQSYSVKCLAAPGVRSEQILVKYWYPGTDSQRSMSFAIRVREVPEGVVGANGFLMQFHQGGGHQPPFRLQWGTDENGNMSVEGGVRWDHLENGLPVEEYVSIFRAPIERNVWQRFIVQIDPGPVAGIGPCPNGPGGSGSITVWTIDNATGELRQPMPTYRGQVGFRHEPNSAACLTDFEYQYKVGQYKVTHDNILDLDNVAYGKRWNNITKNRLIGYKKSVLRLPFEEVSIFSKTQDRSWTWNNGVAGDPTTDYDNDGTIHGTVRHNAFGVNGRSLRFDGVANHVTVPIDPNDFDVGNYMTVSTWFKTSARPVTNRGLVMIDEYGSNWKVLLYASDNSVSFGVKHPGGAYSRLDRVVRGGLYADNEWHHVVGTFNRFAADGKRIKLYIDGVKVLEHAGNDLPILRGDQRLVVGKYSTSNFFEGDIDDVGLFNYAMTEEDVYRLWYERGTP